MIALNVDEAYAFDYLSILHIKKEKNPQAFDAWNDCCSFLRIQIGESNFKQILDSQEYKEMLDANLKTFNMVDLAKENKCSARDVDICNYERYKAKINLQNKFFAKKISEIKIGYEKYEK